jgi:BirA family biotin operon repressor/biotin-[acetyl-CoA-carboxylase] ligase
MTRSTPTPLTFRALRLLADGNFRSEEELARTIGVSRTTVWKALQNLNEWGVTLFKVHGRGYRLVTAVDWLDRTQIRSHIGPRAEMFQVHVVDTAHSTNDILLSEALVGAPSGLTLAAELQTQGRGRRGRTWHTGLGGALTFSVLWRFEQGVGALTGLGPAVSLAVVRALRDLGIGEAMLKWPNDVLWRHQKLAGVLVELQGDALGPSAAVIGIGINVHLEDAVRGRIDQAVTDLVSAGASLSRNRILGVVLGRLAEMLEGFAVEGFAPLRAEWESYHALAGRTVAVTLPDHTEQVGVAAGVADDGGLLVQTTSGLRRFHSGEISLRPLERDLRRA